MGNKIWHNAGAVNAYQYIADALWMHDTWRVVYMTANLKVICCDEGFFDVLVGGEFPDHSMALLYITNSIRMLAQEISARYGHEVWQNIENAMHSGTSTATVGGEDFTITIMRGIVIGDYVGIAEFGDMIVTTAVSRSAKHARTMLIRELRKFMRV